jgi:hypothetical protein
MINMSMQKLKAVPAMFLLLLGTASVFSQDPTVDLRLVDYAGLKQAVFKQRGKVLIVDFWGDF